LIYVVRYALISLYTVFWASAVCIVSVFDRSGEAGVACARQWARWILWTCRIEVATGGVENVDPSGPYVVMSNHQSVFDIVALVGTLPVSFRFVAKHELTRIPFFGWGLLAGGHVVIDRRDHDRAVSSLKRAAERVRTGTSVIVFPEGTRSKTGDLRAFKSGGFHLAIQAGVPILPIAISGSRRIAPRGSLRAESGRMLVRFGKPIPTDRLTADDSEQLKAQVRQAILAGFDIALQG
jgi:1-acyl-sn-glycerol-3-phosphate acyltransferase